MNISEKITKKVNTINTKADALNERISPVAIPKLPQIKAPSRKSQKIGALSTASVSVGAIVVGTAFIGSKITTILGVVGLVGAGFSYWDSKNHSFKD